MNSKNDNIKWMYDGPKSLVNREDYLLGKKIDKNFELFSDVAIKQKNQDNTDLYHPQNSTSGIISNLNTKTTVLDLGIVRNEDPLVAIKLQQENRKRELLENPLLKLKTQRILREAYERKFNKKKHKSKNKKNKKEKPIKNKKKKKDSSNEDSDDGSRRRDNEKNRHRKHKENRNHDSSSDCAQRKKQSEYNKNNYYQMKYNDRPTSSKSQSSCSKPKLSAEEIEAKRQEMISNAKWREDVRNETIEKAAIKIKAEEKQLEKEQAAVIRPKFVSITTSVDSVSQRLQTKRQTLQRSHDYMEKSFATRK